MKPFITSNSGDGEYYVKINVGSMNELHEAHDKVMAAFSAHSAGEVGVKAERESLSDDYAAIHRLLSMFVMDGSEPTALAVPVGMDHNEFTSNWLAALDAAQAIRNRSAS